MKLKKEEIKKIATLVLENLRKSTQITLRGSTEQIVSKIEAVLSKNMEQEAAIEEEVKKLMDQYRAQIASGAIDPQKVYTMMKKQVAKERKFVL